MFPQKERAFPFSPTLSEAPRMGLCSDGRMQKERTHMGAFPQLDVRTREVSEAFRLNVALRSAQWDF